MSPPQSSGSDERNPSGNGPPLDVVVWAEYACFTRPENKVERLSYPVPTPSGARGTVETIYWKPEFQYRIREIHILQPIRYAAIFRNEVAVRAGAGMDAIYVEDQRAQRHALVLYQVAYRIRADVVVKAGVDADPAKYRDQFRRRVTKGQCFARPFLGVREFSCEFAAPENVPDDVRRKTNDLTPIDDSRELGLMLFDIAFGGTPKNPANVPLFFEARLDKGVLRVPDALYNQREALKL